MGSNFAGKKIMAKISMVRDLIGSVSTGGKTGRGVSNGMKRMEGILVRAVNARRDDKERKVWRPAGMPMTVRADGWLPLTPMPLPGAKVGDCEATALFWRKGNRIGVSVAGAAEDMMTGQIDALAELTAEMLMAEVVEPGIVRMLMKHQRPVYLTYDTGGKMTFHGEMPELPSAGLTVVDETTLSEPLQNVALTGLSNSRNGALTAEDQRRVTAAMLDAYERLMAKAEDRGLLLQPVFARYRLEDGAGDTVACSATALASGITGFQCCGSVEMTGSDGLSTLAGGALTARGYRLRLLAPEKLDEPWRTIIRSLSVELTPQIDPVDRSALCQAAVSNNGNTTTVTLHLPGIGAASAYAKARRRVLVRDALAGSGGNFRIHERYQSPLGGGIADHTVAIRRNAPVAPSVTAGFRRDLISYSACCHTSQLTLLANRMSEGFKGHDAKEMMLSATTTGRWSAEVKVTIRRGNGVTESASKHMSGTSNCPTLLSPLLIYPDTEASEMTITISGQAGTRTGTFALTPVPEAGIAYYLSPELRPMELPSSGGSVSSPESVPSPTVRQGTVDICRRLHYGTLTDSLRLSDSEIRAIMTAPRNRGAWDHSREKVMIYGGGGTQVLAISGEGKIHSLAPLDNRGILSAEAVREAAGKRGLVHLAVAGGDLVEIDQSGVTTLLRNCRAEEAARCQSRDEIWLAGGGESLRRLTADGEIIQARIDGEATDAHIHRVGSRMLIECANSLYDPENEIWSDGGTEWLVNERYEGEINRDAEIRLFASECAGTVKISGDNGSRVAEKLVEIEVDGEINAPICLPMPGPRRRFLEFCIDVTTGSDGEWRGIYQKKLG